ncbi:MAG: methyl-accepting chemotaxis protein [Magnetococcus sp. WYHC-3]
MKLASRMIWLPMAVLLVVFLCMGAIFVWLINDVTDSGWTSGMTRLIQSERRQLQAGLSIVTAGQGPADAYLGLESGDDGMAIEVVKQIRGMGLDGVVVLNPQGKILFPREGVPDGLAEPLSAAVKAVDGIRVREMAGHMVGLAPIIDVDTAVGVIALYVALPADIQKLGASVLEAGTTVTSGTTPEGATAQNQTDMKAAEHLAHSNQQLLAHGHLLLRSMLTTVVATLVVGLLLIAIILRSTARGVIDPVIRIRDMADAISSGRLTRRLGQGGGHGDEVAETAEHVDKMADFMTRTARAMHQQAGTIGAAMEEMAGIGDRLSGMAEGIHGMSKVAVRANNEIDAEAMKLCNDADSAAGNMERVNEAVSHLSENINTIAAAAEQASQNVATMAAAAEQMGANVSGVRASMAEVSLSVKTVSVAVAQMSGSQSNVRGMCRQALEESTQASNQIQRTMEAMETLTRAAQEIGKAVKMINDIASQTNMLALNASIEAAGAGEAGKGFAVVANEVKELATQTSAVTRQIAEQVMAIQERARDASGRVSGVTAIIDRLDAGTREISAAVDGQEREGRRITDSIGAVGQSATDVDRNIQELESASQEVARAASEAAAGATEIARSSGDAAIGAERIVDEVRQATDNSRSIRQKGADILSRSGEVQKSGLRVLEVTTAINAEVSQSQDLAHVLQRNGESLRMLVQGLEVGQAPFDLREFKRDLLNRVFGVVRPLRNRSTELPESFQSGLGAWLQGEGRDRYAELEAFLGLVSAYGELERMLREGLRLGGQGAFERAWELLEQVERTVLDRVLEAMDALHIEQRAWRMEA